MLHLSLTWYFFGLNDIRSEIISDCWPIVQYSKIRSRWFPLLAILVKTNERLGVQNWNIFEFSASGAFRIWKLLSSKGLALSGAITLKELRWGFSRAGLARKVRQLHMINVRPGINRLVKQVYGVYGNRPYEKSLLSIYNPYNLKMLPSTQMALLKCNIPPDI